MKERDLNDDLNSISKKLYLYNINKKFYNKKIHVQHQILLYRPKKNP